MPAAKGPPCEGGCGKRVSMHRVTRCPYDQRVLCLKCKCPDADKHAAARALWNAVFRNKPMRVGRRGGMSR